jgi:hypothetical protein
LGKATRLNAIWLKIVIDGNQALRDLALPDGKVVYSGSDCSDAQTTRLASAIFDSES